MLLVIPEQVWSRACRHMFKDRNEQAVFMFARVDIEQDGLRLTVEDLRCVGAEDWKHQSSVHLEMDDNAFPRLMWDARERGLAVIDCHSHPGSREDVQFSFSDWNGISEFAGYAKWKLGGLPYVGMVAGEESLDAVAWYGETWEVGPVARIDIVGTPTTSIATRGSWSSAGRWSW